MCKLMGNIAKGGGGPGSRVGVVFYLVASINIAKGGGGAGEDTSWDFCMPLCLYFCCNISDFRKISIYFSILV